MVWQCNLLFYTAQDIKSVADVVQGSRTTCMWNDHVFTVAFLRVSGSVYTLEHTFKYEL